MSDVSYMRTASSATPDSALSAAVVDVVMISANPGFMSGHGPKDGAVKPVTKTGSAFKHGYSFCTWKRRFFKLDGANIKYYAKSTSRKPKGEIKLSPYCICQPCEVNDERAANAVSYIKLVNGKPHKEYVSRPHGISISVPEAQRTFYIHFDSTKERDEWHIAVSHNLEVLRYQPNVIEKMISKVTGEIATDNIQRHQAGIVKMALRARYSPRINTLSTDKFVLSLASMASGSLDKLMITYEASQVKQATETGTTLLIKAATLGHADIVEYLIKEGSDVDAKTKVGDTALIIACRLNHSRTVEVLLQHGADKEIRNDFGESAFSEGDHKDKLVIKLLRASSTSTESGESTDRYTDKTANTDNTGNIGDDNQPSADVAKIIKDVNPETLKSIEQERDDMVEATQNNLSTAEMKSKEFLKSTEGGDEVDWKQHEEIRRLSISLQSRNKSLQTVTTDPTDLIKEEEDEESGSSGSED